MKSFWCTEFMYQVHPWLRNPAYFDILSIDREEVLSSIQIQCPHQCWREGDADASSSLILVSRSIYPFPYVHATAHSAMVSIPKLREFSLQQFAVEDDELLFQRNPPKRTPIRSIIVQSTPFSWWCSDWWLYLSIHLRMDLKQRIH